MSGFIPYSFAREIAERVYRDGTMPLNLPEGWELDLTFNNNSLPVNLGRAGVLSLGNGFYAYALKPVASNTSVSSNTRVLAFRGTERNSPADLFADVSDIGYGQFNLKVQNVIAADVVNAYLAENYLANNYTELVGHSLGGALVQWSINNANLTAIRNVLRNHRETPITVPLTSIASRLHFHTFNAPGITLSPATLGKPETTVSLVEGEHHVMALRVGFKAPWLMGDLIHLLGGATVGGGWWGTIRTLAPMASPDS